MKDTVPVASVRMAAGSILSVVVLATAGCGSSGSETTSTGGSGASTAEPAGAAPAGPAGAKGENPTGEPATTLHLSGEDCKALKRIAEGRLGRRFTLTSKPTPPLSECHLGGRGAAVNIYLDTSSGANKRYEFRIEETVQFNADHPAGLPHPVPNVGEKSYMNSSASWIPALGSLLAVRGPRWLTVTISVRGLSGMELRAVAATLARSGFKLSAAG